MPKDQDSQRQQCSNSKRPLKRRAEFNGGFLREPIPEDFFGYSHTGRKWLIANLQRHWLDFYLDLRANVFDLYNPFDSTHADEIKATFDAWTTSRGIHDLWFQDSCWTSLQMWAALPRDYVLSKEHKLIGIYAPNISLSSFLQFKVTVPGPTISKRYEPGDNRILHHIQDLYSNPEDRESPEQWEAKSKKWMLQQAAPYFKAYRKWFAEEETIIRKAKWTVLAMSGMSYIDIANINPHTSLNHKNTPNTGPEDAIKQAVWRFCEQIGMQKPKSYTELRKHVLLTRSRC